MNRTPAGQYKPGTTFTCVKRPFEPTAPNGMGEQCGATILIHGYHWCAQVCPKCLANYFTGFGTDMGLYLDHGFYPADTAARVRATIAAHDGQYVPQFS